MTGAYYNEIDPYCAEWLRNLIKAGEIADGDVDERDIRDVTPGELMGYGQCHFFAGIGGWSRALRLAGWPDDQPVWTGSCPCQGFSAAGRGRGFADERHLWPYWFHLIRVVRPAVIFGEQVASKLALSWLDLVLDDLEGEGYAVGSADLCAASVGAFHIRQRLWFVAESEHRGQPWRDTDGARAGAVMPPSDALLADPHRPGRDRRPQDAEQETGCGTREPVHCEVDLLGDAGDSGLPFCEREAVEGKGRGEEGGAVEQSGEALGAVEHSSGSRYERDILYPVQRGREGTGEDERLTGSSPTGILADAGSGPSPGRPHEPGWEAEGRIASGRVGQDGHFWSSAVWLPCRDGKWRATEPGIQPLAHGLFADMGCLRPGEDSPFRVIKDPKTGKSRGQAPWRIGMLKGYGNAIVPEVAAAFIRSVIQIRGAEKGGAMSKKPDWWPECPYPEDIFPMGRERFAEIVLDPEARAALAGMLGRIFWNIASESIWERFKGAA